MSWYTVSIQEQVILAHSCDGYFTGSFWGLILPFICRLKISKTNTCTCRYMWNNQMVMLLKKKTLFTGGCKIYKFMYHVVAIIQLWVVWKINFPNLFIQKNTYTKQKYLMINIQFTDKDFLIMVEIISKHIGANFININHILTLNAAKVYRS